MSKRVERQIENLNDTLARQVYHLRNLEGTIEICNDAVIDKLAAVIELLVQQVNIQERRLQIAEEILIRSRKES